MTRDTSMDGGGGFGRGLVSRRREAVCVCGIRLLVK